MFINTGSLIPLAKVGVGDIVDIDGIMDLLIDEANAYFH